MDGEGAVHTSEAGRVKHSRIACHKKPWYKTGSAFIHQPDMLRVRATRHKSALWTRQWANLEQIRKAQVGVRSGSKKYQKPGAVVLDALSVCFLEQGESKPCPPKWKLN